MLHSVHLAPLTDPEGSEEAAVSLASFLPALPNG